MGLCEGLTARGRGAACFPYNTRVYNYDFSIMDEGALDTNLVARSARPRLHGLVRL